jgi:hypothetical protein
VRLDKIFSHWCARISTPQSPAAPWLKKNHERFSSKTFLIAFIILRVKSVIGGLSLPFAVCGLRLSRFHMRRCSREQQSFAQLSTLPGVTAMLISL